MDQKLSTVYVKNLGKDVTRDELVALFGLDKPDLVKNTTQITFVHGASANTAILEVVDTKLDELVKLNGVTFKDRDFTITCDDSERQATSMNVDTSDDTATENDGGEILYMQIDTRIPEWNFQQVTDMEVVEALEVSFAEDPTKSVEDLGRHKKSLQGIFRIDSADYSIYTGATLKIRDRDIPFTPWRRTPNQRGPSYGRREGTLITIYGAFRLEHRSIENDSFDQAFEALNVEVIKPTLPQLRKGTSTLNNNRYLVVEKLDGKEDLKKRIGSRITVDGTTFNMVYDGVQRHCWTCMRTHGNHCPVKARNDFLRQKRQEQNNGINRKIYSTSTLRHANQLALTTDVFCMSGGGIGHVLNAIQYDKKPDEIIIAAGTNELVRAADDLREFVYTVEKSIEKLRAVTQQISTSLVLPSVPLVTPHLKAKFQFLEEKVGTIENLKVIKPKDVEYSGIHPTEKGTKSILMAINESFDGEIVVDGAEDDDLTRRRYQQVQALYRVGCRACDTPELSTSLCGACRTAAENVDATILQEMIDKETEAQFPAMETSVINNNKRPISDDDDEDGNKENPSKR